MTTKEEDAERRSIPITPVDDLAAIVIAWQSPSTREMALALADENRRQAQTTDLTIKRKAQDDRRS